MIRIDKIVGARTHKGAEDDLNKQLHRLEHEHAVDFLILNRMDLARRRFRAKTQNGQDIAVSLPRDETLFDGAVLIATQTQAIVVKVEAEEWLRLKVPSKSAALQVGFHAGNLHWRVKFDEDDLLVAIEQDIGTYMDRLALLIKAGTVISVLERDDGADHQKQNKHEMKGEKTELGSARIEGEVFHG